MSISIYTITSPLHNEEAIKLATQNFLQSLNIEYNFQGNDFSNYGQSALNLIYVRTGGTEGVLKPLIPQLQTATKQPFYLLTSGQSNSLAASMEILSYLRQQNIPGEILHSSAQYISHRIQVLHQVAEAKQKLSGMRLGVIGKPSDWLISSSVDAPTIQQKLGITLVDISMDEMMQVYQQTTESTSAEYIQKAPTQAIKQAIPGAMRIYNAINTLVEKHQLQGLSIRCFDLLTAVQNTGCIALAKLNSEGIVAGCEGDIPALLSMAITKAVTGVSGFQANPSRIDPETGKLLFAHCTIPFNMLQSYDLDTHFESGIGVGVRGYMQEGPITIFKVSGNLSRHYIAQGILQSNGSEDNLCRTQQHITLCDKSQIQYFLTEPIGNHHIIIPGHYQEVLTQLLKS